MSALAQASPSGSSRCGLRRGQTPSKKARQLAVEHDRLIEEARKPVVDPFSALSDAELARIETSGGPEVYLKFLDERARESVGISTKRKAFANGLRKVARSKTPPTPTGRPERPPLY